jgi:hypothetical protein
VNRAVGQMDSITQQNAALVEEAGAASRSLEDQGRQLIDAVTIFRLDGALHGQPMQARAAPPPKAPVVRAQERQTSAARAAAPVPATAHSRTEGWETF